MESALCHTGLSSFSLVVILADEGGLFSVPVPLTGESDGLQRNSLEGSKGLCIGQQHHLGINRNIQRTAALRKERII